MFALLFALILVPVTLMLGVANSGNWELPGWQRMPQRQQAEARDLAWKVAIYRDALVNYARDVPLSDGAFVSDAQLQQPWPGQPGHTYLPIGYVKPSWLTNTVQGRNIYVYASAWPSTLPNISREIARLDALPGENDAGSGMAGEVRTVAGAKRLYSPIFFGDGLTYTLSLPASATDTSPVWITPLPS